MRSWPIAVATVVLLVSVAQVSGAIQNGGFETGFLPGWDTIGTTSIETGAYGAAPTQGTYQALITNSAGSVPLADLETFLGVPAETLAALGTRTPKQGSAIRQTGIVVATAGATISFDFSFLTNEATPSPWNDFAFYTLQTEGFWLADTFSAGFAPSATPFSEETGYSTVTTVPLQPGEYTLGFGVMDRRDTFGDSGLLIDDVQQHHTPEPASVIVWSLLVGLTWAGGMLRFLRRRRRQCWA